MKEAYVRKVPSASRTERRKALTASDVSKSDDIADLDDKIAYDSK